MAKTQKIIFNGVYCAAYQRFSQPGEPATVRFYNPTESSLKRLYRLCNSPNVIAGHHAGRSRDTSWLMRKCPVPLEQHGGNKVTLHASLSSTPSAF